MGFGWLGTFRQGQWKAYRRFVLNERRDVGRRIEVINAELARIGEVTVHYNTKEDGTITEQRVGFAVTPNSTLGKLLQAYAAQGGNPFDVSLFLSPDSVYPFNGMDVSTQPYGGVVYAKSNPNGVGGADTGGNLSVLKYWPARTAQRKELLDTSIASAVDTTRRWVNQVIATRFHDLEARIIKQCDLREQLKNELEAMTMAVGGTSGAIPMLDEAVFSTAYGVVKTVSYIDKAFYNVDEDGTPDMKTPKTDGSGEVGGIVGGIYASLFQDVPGEEDNTAL